MIDGSTCAPPPAPMIYHAPRLDTALPTRRPGAGAAGGGWEEGAEAEIDPLDIRSRILRVPGTSSVAAITTATSSSNSIGGAVAAGLPPASPALIPLAERMDETLLGSLIASAGHRAGRASATGSAGTGSAAAYGGPAESYLVVDANHAVRKLMRWRELMPRVKPFFGEYVCVYMSMCICMSMCVYVCVYVYVYVSLALISSINQSVSSSFSPLVSLFA
jgi:hypothetical protein